MQRAELDEKRDFLRVDVDEKIEFKTLEGDKFSGKSQVRSLNVSASGILFRIEGAPPALSSIIWVSLSPRILNVCTEIEEGLILHEGGIFGRVVRISEDEPDRSYHVAVAFLKNC